MEREPQPSLETATGQALDRLASQIGFSRTPDEPDAALRARLQEAVKAKPNEPYKLVDLRIVKRLALKASDAPSYYGQIGVTDSKRVLLAPEEQCKVCSFRGHCISLANHIGGTIGEVVKEMPGAEHATKVMRESVRRLVEQGVPLAPIAASLRVTTRRVNTLMLEAEEDKKHVNVSKTRKDEADW